MFVVVVWFYCSSWLAFLFLAYLINKKHSFLLHWIFCFGGYLFVHTPIFFEKYLIFCVFLSVPHLVDNYAKFLDERGWNLMYNRTYLASLLYILFSNFLKSKDNFCGCIIHWRWRIIKERNYKLHTVELCCFVVICGHIFLLDDTKRLLTYFVA